MKNNLKSVEDISSFIINLRKKYNLSREELAEKANLNAVHLWRIENGITNIKFNTLINIAEALNVEIYYSIKEND